MISQVCQVSSCCRLLVSFLSLFSLTPGKKKRDERHQCDSVRETIENHGSISVCFLTATLYNEEYNMVDMYIELDVFFWILDNTVEKNRFHSLFHATQCSLGEGIIKDSFPLGNCVWSLPSIIALLIFYDVHLLFFPFCFRFFFQEVEGKCFTLSLSTLPLCCSPHTHSSTKTV